MEKGQIIGQGRTAEIFAWKDHQVLKLLRHGFPAVIAVREAEITQAVCQAGLPAPAVEGTIEVDGRTGVIFERIDGPLLANIFIQKPWQLLRLARILADLHAAIHGCQIPELPSLRERLRDRILTVTSPPTSTKEAVLEALKQLPDGNSVCHGDLHPLNIIMSSRGPVIIDWVNASQGDPLADVARTWLLNRKGTLPSGIPFHRRLLFNSIRASFHSTYMKRYRKLRPAPQKKIEAWQLPVMAARLAENIPEEESRLQAFIKASLQQRK